MLSLYEFETVEAAPVEAAPADAALTPEANGEAVPPAAVSEAASVWDDPRFAEAVESRTLELLDTRLAPISQLLQQSLAGEQSQQAPQTLAPPDPYSENYQAEFAAYQQARDEQMLGRFEQMIGRISQPLEAQAAAAQTAEGNQRVDDMITDDITRNGDLVPAAKAQIRPLAEAMFGQITAKGYSGPRAAEMAVSQAASVLRAITKEAGEAAVTQKQNELATLSGARTEPGVGANGVRTMEPVGADVHALARKYGSQASAIRQNGHI